MDQTELDGAATIGDLETVVRLIAAGGLAAADVDRAFVVAAAQGHTPIVRHLHANGIVGIEAQGERALREAAMRGHLSVVRYLHQNGADILAENSEVLRLAARAGHEHVVAYLHDNGAQHAVLSEHSRTQIREMQDEISEADPIYHPSRFWDALNESHYRLLLWGGEQNVKRTINQSYFNALPTTWRDARILNLARLWARSWDLRALDVELDDPDRDPQLWTSWYPGYFIFKGDRDVLLRLYRRYVGVLYAYGLRTDRHHVLARLQEPEVGNPIRIRRQGKLISQDLVNSVRERNAIVDALTASRCAVATPAVIAELGAGYGRLGHVLLATTRCRYMVFDVPPALHISQWYLSALFPDKRIFPFRRFRSYADIVEELAEADVAFFTPNQLQQFPPRVFDAFATISSLHEMRREQIDHFIGLMTAKTKYVIYLKQQANYENPHDQLRIQRKDYVFPADWRATRQRADPLNPGFFELALGRVAETI